MDRVHPHFTKGFAYVDFENPDDAEKAVKYMDGGLCLSPERNFSSKLPIAFFQYVSVKKNIA